MALESSSTGSSSTFPAPAAPAAPAAPVAPAAPAPGSPASPASPPPSPPPERGGVRTADAIRTVLAVDDDEGVLARYERGFGPDRTVHRTTDPAAALALVQATPCDLAIVELRIGSASGIALARELKRLRPDIAVALCSGYLSVEIAVTAVRSGVDIVLFKPVTAREILQRIDQGTAYEPDLDETPTLERAEWEHISRVLADCKGNISMAARRLGIYRSSLQRRLRKTPPAPVRRPSPAGRQRRHGPTGAPSGPR